MNSEKYNTGSLFKFFVPDFVFLSLLIVSAALPLFFPYFIAMDGPTHIATGDILRHLLLHDDPQTAEFYQIRPYSTTNSLVQYIAAALLLLFAPAMVEKLIAAFLVFLTPFSIWTLARQYAFRNPWILLAAVPFGYSSTLVSGNYNTILGLGFFILALAVLAKRDGRLTVRGACAFSVFLFLSAWAHPLGGVFASVCGGGLVLFALLVGFDWNAASPHGRFRRFSTLAMCRAAPIIGAAIPALAMILIYVLHHGGENLQGGAVTPDSLPHRIVGILTLRQLYATDSLQIGLCIAAAVAVWFSMAKAVVCRRADLGRRREDAVLVVAIIAALLALVIPNGGAGSDLLAPRINGYPALFAIAWMSSVAVPRLVGRVQASLFVALTGLFWATNWSSSREIDRDEALYLSVLEHADPHSVILAINTGRIVEKNEDLLHLHHLAAGPLHAVMVNNWNAHNPGFPISFRAERDPYRFFSPFGLGRRDFSGFERAMNRDVDYVFLWNKKAELDSSTEGLMSQLAENYHIVAHSVNELGYEAVLYKKNKTDIGRGSGK